MVVIIVLPSYWHSITLWSSWNRSRSICKFLLLERWMSAPQTNLFSKQPLCLKYIPQNELLLPPRHCLQIKGIKQLIFGPFLKSPVMSYTCQAAAIPGVQTRVLLLSCLWNLVMKLLLKVQHLLHQWQYFGIFPAFNMLKRLHTIHRVCIFIIFFYHVLFKDKSIHLGKIIVSQLFWVLWSLFPQRFNKFEIWNLMRKFSLLLCPPIVALIPLKWTLFAQKRWRDETWTFQSLAHCWEENWFGQNNDCRAWSDIPIKSAATCFLLPIVTCVQCCYFMND